MKKTIKGTTNIYVVAHKDDFMGLYVAAETRGQAKAYMANEEGYPFTEYYARIAKKDVDLKLYGYLTADDCRLLGLKCYDESGNEADE